MRRVQLLLTSGRTGQRQGKVRVVPATFRLDMALAGVYFTHKDAEGISLAGTAAKGFMHARRKTRIATEKYGAIVEQIRQRIRGGVWHPGQRLPIRRDLAQEFGVTLVTIQKAFDVLHSDGFIFSRVGSGTFVAGYPPHLHHFALVLYEEDSKSRYVRALQAEAARRTASGPERFSVYLDIDHHAAGDGQRRLMDDIAAGRLAGCIFDMHPIMLGDNPLLRDRSVPKVALVGDSHLPDMPSISTDVRQWFQSALDWLEQRGRTRIAWLGIPNMPPWQVQAMTAAVQRRGLITSPAWTVAVDYRFQSWIPHSVAAIFQGPPGSRPDGLLIADDNIAEGVVAGLDTIGLRIPRDLDVVSLNNFPLPLSGPVRQLGYDIRERMDVCVKTLRAMQAGSKVPHSLTLPCRWLEDIEPADSGKPMIPAARNPLRNRVPTPAAGTI